MKRNKFILSALAVALVPWAVIAQSIKKMVNSGKGFKINAGEGRIHGHIKLKGVNSNILDVKISGSDTDGAFAMFEQISLSQGKGTPLHVHHLQHEVFYVVEGAYYFQIGEENYHLNAGDSIFLPMKIPHAWIQVSEKGKMIVTFHPAGKMEEFFVAMAALNHEPTNKEIVHIFANHEMEVVGPPLKIN